MITRVHQDVYYLLKPKDGIIEALSDMEDVGENSNNKENLNVLDIVEVIGVSKLDVMYKCITL